MSGLFSSLQSVLGTWGMLLILFATAGCGGSSQSLTASQLQKLDPALRTLVKGENPERRLSSTTRSDGTVAYSVFIRTTDAEKIREAGIPVNSASGNILTARLSTDEIRQAARLDAVTSIERSGEATQHAN